MVNYKVILPAIFTPILLRIQVVIYYQAIHESYLSQIVVLLRTYLLALKWVLEDYDLIVTFYHT